MPGSGEYFQHSSVERFRQAGRNFLRTCTREAAPIDDHCVAELHTPGIFLDRELFLVEQDDWRGQVDEKFRCNVEYLHVIMIETNQGNEISADDIDLAESSAHCEGLIVSTDSPEKILEMTTHVTF